MRGYAGLLLRIATRSSGRFFAYWLTLLLVSFILAVALLVGREIGDGSARAAARFGADLMVVPAVSGVADGTKLFGGVPVNSFLPEGLEARIAATTGITRVAPQYIFSSAADPCCDLGEILLVGFDPTLDFTVLPWLRPGDGLHAEKDEILAGSRVMKAPGAVIRFFTHPLTLAARLERSGSATFDTALFIPLSSLAAMERASSQGATKLKVPWGKPSLLLIRLEPEINPQQMAHALKRQYPGIHLLTIPESLPGNRLLLDKIGRGRWPLTVTAWLVALLFGGTVLSLRFQQRRPDLGLLRSFGCSKAILSLIFGLETFITALAASIAGCLVACLLLRVCGPFLSSATGVTFLPGWISRAATGIIWSLPAFALALGVETVVIVILMLRYEPADLLRGV